MSDFIPQLPPIRPKTDLAEQERLIAEWVANGGVITRTEAPPPKSRPAHRVEKTTTDLDDLANKLIKKIQSKYGLSEYAYIKMFEARANSRQLKNEINFLLKNQYGLTLTTKMRKNGNGKPVKMMELC